MGGCCSLFRGGRISIRPPPQPSPCQGEGAGGASPAACATIALMRMNRLLLLTASLWCFGTGMAWAQGTVYRCPGNPVLYTDQITEREAKERNCRTIEGAPITVVQLPKPKTGGAANGNSSAASRPADSKVDPAAQKARDTDSRRILTEELRRSEEQLAALQKEFNNGEPERLGSERNYQTYLDRVASMKAAIVRKESDIAALKRELAKLPS
jgi:hypothetical protein